MPNNRYQRGARAERELLGTLYDRGWSVIRSSGSGVNAISPDLLAAKDRNCIIIECKAWDRGSLSIEPEQFLKMLEWERNTSFPTYVAWRISRKGWFFIKLGEFTKGERNYNVTMRRAFEINRQLEGILPQAQGAPEAQPATAGLA